MPTLPTVLQAASAVELKERLETMRRHSPFLLYREGDGRQRIVVLEDRDRLAIGRQPATDIALSWDCAVSRVHAIVERVGDEWTLVDDGSSRNGSFVNGERVRGRRRLVDGDVVRIGETVLGFVVPNEREISTSTIAVTTSDVPVVTAAQRRVLVALCRPLAGGRFGSVSSNQQIADELVLGVETVKSHMQALFEAFGIQDLPQNRKRAELARLAFKRNAVREEELLGGTADSASGASR